MKPTEYDGPVRAAVCSRQNSDHRSYKVLMNVAGDTGDFAITPGLLRRAARDLAGELGRPRPDCLVGFAPGGIPIAVALAYELDVPAVIAYKTRLGLPDELTWSEPHCFNATFYFYGATAGMSVVLVDDEVDSGNTVCNAAMALRGRGVDIVGVGCAVEVLHAGRSEGRRRLDELGLTLKSLRRLDVENRPASGIGKSISTLGAADV